MPQYHICRVTVVGRKLPANKLRLFQRWRRRVDMLPMRRAEQQRVVHEYVTRPEMGV